MPAPDDLKPDRKARFGEAARNGSRRLLREIERIGEAGPFRPALHAAAFGRLTAGLESRNRHCGRKQEIELVEPGGELAREVCPRQRRRHIVHMREGAALIGDLQQSRVHGGALIDGHRLRNGGGA
jgi:hypothetical protein